MKRRCIICGQTPGEQCVYPRNMKEARRWENLANLRSYDVDTESLCQHGCVCALHLDSEQECGSDPDAVSSQRNSGGKISANRKKTSIKWSASDTGRCKSQVPQDCCSHTTNTNINGNLRPMRLESINGDRSNIELHRCRGAMLQGNLYSQMRKNFHPQQPTGTRGGTAPPRNSKARQQIIPKLYAYIKYPILQNANVVPEQSPPPLVWCPNPAPDAFNCKCSPQPQHSNSRQRTQNNTQIQSQQKPTSFNLQQFQSDDSFSSTTSDQCSCTTCDGHQESMPEIKNKCVQTYCKCQLKDQGVQCSQKQEVHCFQDQEVQCKCSSAAVSQSAKAISISKSDCNKARSRSSQRSTSLATKYDISSKCFPSIGNINMPIFTCCCEEQKYSANAVNVLLMNGPRHNKYEGPNPEICVLESDLADCNERAVFPDVDKPSYRLCRAATSPSNTKGKQDEANVLVLEDDSMDGCSPEGQANQGQSQNELQFVEGIDCMSQGIQPGQFGDNWIDSPYAANYNKVLELQRSRINELENLLQQHNKLQQTIQARMAELQSQEMQAETAKNE
ncbi:hypothetical protein KR032_005945 [Drosophila birchii]|nr:hypothetical protein KR032_005945 [Drosophila birchii]